MKENSKKGESKSIEVLYFYTFWKTVGAGNNGTFKLRIRFIEGGVQMGATAE